MKPILPLALSALLLVGCAPKQVDTPTLRIGVALYQQNDTFISGLTQQMETMAQADALESGTKTTISVSDAAGSQYAQNDQIDRFLELNYDIICINIVDRTAAAVLIDQAKAHDTPVIFFNREPVEEDLNRWEGAYYVGSRAAVAGQLQGEMVANAWADPTQNLDKNGDGVLQYVMLEGEPGHQDALLRTEYSIATIEKAGIRAQRLATDTANWHRGQAAAKMTQWLTDFGDEIELVLSNNDDMALGAIDALQTAEVPTESFPFILGVDATDAGISALETGALDGTVRNDAQGQARSILDLSYLLADGQDPTEALEMDGKYIWQSYTAVLPVVSEE